MKTFTFDIYGTHQDPFGNPFPKLKMTGRQQWTPKAQGYAMWKRFVQNAFIRSLPQDEMRKADLNILACGKPLVIGDENATMQLEIAFKHGHHGDPENIFGSIADALFFNDKNLYGGFSPCKRPDGKRGGYVRCIITVSETLSA